MKLVMNFHMSNSSSEPVLYCIGDSHASFFSGEDRIQPNWPEAAMRHIPLFKVLKMGSPLAYNLSRKGTRSQGRETLFKLLKTSVPAHSHVMLIFGEIDCRAHVIKQAQSRGCPVSEVINGLLDGYFSVIKEVAEMGHTLIIYNAIPSRIKVPTKSSADPSFIAIGTCLERNAVTKLFNQGLSDRCQEHEIYFLSIFDALLDSNGLTNTWYYFDTIHLSQRAMPLVWNALRDLFPGWELAKAKVIVPSPWDRLVDRISKRMRRLAKIQPPARSGNYSIV